MQRNYSAFIIGLSLLSVVTSCQKNDRYGINSANKIEVKINRFDRAIIGIDTANIEAEVRGLYNDFPGFMSEYVADIIEENPSDTLKVQNQILEFLKDTAFTDVNRKVLEVYTDVSAIEKSVSFAYTGIKHLFPEKKLPEIYFFVSGFNRALMLTDNYIAIGVDLYLGSDYPKYSEITYQYLTQNMRKESVPVDIVSALLYRYFPMNATEDRLLDNMIYHGKILYLLSVLLPEEKPELIIGYSNEKLEWSKKFEKEIWSSIVEQKHLFSTDMQLINKYINDAPFTSPISQESPGRLATWIGWQIVESYMNTNKDIEIKTLMNETDGRKILESSGYQP